MEEIFRIKPSKARVRDLWIMAKERLEMLKLIPKERTFKVIEENIMRLLSSF